MKTEVHPVSFTQINIEYGIQFLYFESEVFQKQIHYKIFLSFIPSGSSQYEVKVDRSKVFYNHREVDLVSEQLSETIGKPLFPIKLAVNSKMELLKLKNFEEIAERWHQAKKQIRTYYVGKSAQEIISSMDLAYGYISHVKQIIKKNLFFDLYFFPSIYSETPEEVGFNLYPFIPPLAYKIEKREIYKNRTGKTVVHLKGVCTDKRSLQDIENRSPVVLTKGTEPELNGVLDLKYKLGRKTQGLYSLNGKLTVGKGKKELRRIEVEIYKLDHTCK
jgi:hypothetical protein